MEADLAAIRTELGRFGRQVSGYSLEHLLPERGFDVARALVGSEGTLALVLGATVRLVADPSARVLVVLGYPTMADAADATPADPAAPAHRVRGAGLPHRATGARRAGGGRARTCRAATAGWSSSSPATTPPSWPTAPCGWSPTRGALDSLVVTDPAEAAAIWRIREDGAGLGGAHQRRAARRTPAGRTPPSRSAQLGAYLREFEALLAAHRLHGVPYGHFGDGCVHVRIDFPFGPGPRPATAAARRYRPS